VQVAYRDPKPQLAKDLANEIVDAFIRGTFQSRYKSVEQVSDWLSDQMQGLKERSANAQKMLSQFQEKNNVLVNSSDLASNTTVDKLKQISDQLTQAQAERIAKEGQYRVAATGNNPSLLDSIVPDTTLELLQSQHAQALAQYGQLSSKFGTGYPPLVEIKAQIDDINSQIDSEVKTLAQRLEQEFKAAVETENMLRAEYQQQTSEAFALDRKVAEYALLKDEGDSTRNLYNMLQSKLQQARVDAGLGSMNTTIVDRASVPSFPVEPQKSLTLAIGACLGLVTGIGMAFLGAANEDNIESVDQIEAALGLPTLALIPEFAKREISGTAGNLLPEASKAGAIVLRHPSSHAAESYRTLRNSVLLSSLDRPIKTIVFTSSLPGEGKSTSAVNFAIVLAQKGANVLLVDSDLRRPSLSRTFNLKRVDGLSSCLLGDVEVDPVIAPIPSLPELKFVPSGPKILAPSEALGSVRFRRLLEKWESKYDYVIMDSTPVLGISDSIPMASWADAVLVVVRHGITPVRALVRTRNVLARANACIHGFILNGAHAAADDYYLDKYRYRGYYT
jgi:capsular exopolysaccharide synthesis family protein